MNKQKKKIEWIVFFYCGVISLIKNNFHDLQMIREVTITRSNLFGRILV